MNSKDSIVSVDEYIHNYPPHIQELLETIRKIIKDIVPEAEETIKYSIPTYVLHENLVHFAAFEKHIGFYPTPSGIAAFKKELSKYKNAKGSVQFPLDLPLPVDLIRKMVEFRVKEVKKIITKDNSM